METKFSMSPSAELGGKEPYFMFSDQDDIWMPKLKTRQKLEKKYGRKLEQFDKENGEQEHRASDKVWVCWFQGTKNEKYKKQGYVCWRLP